MQAITASQAGIDGKIRSVGAVVGLYLATLGLYSVYWWYAINREMRDLGEAHEEPALRCTPALSALAFASGGCLLVPYVWTAVTTSRRLRLARRVGGVTSGMRLWVIVGLLGAAALIGSVAGGSSAAALIVAVVAAAVLELAAMAYMQILVNEIWQFRTRPGGQPSSSPVEVRAPSMP